MKLELIRVGLLVKLANLYTTLSTLRCLDIGSLEDQFRETREWSYLILSLEYPNVALHFCA